MIAQGNMDDAALAGWHRLEGLTSSAFGHLIRHALGHLDQLFLAAVTITFYIHSELHKLLGFFSYD
jgi:hypothetical protein